MEKRVWNTHTLSRPHRTSFWSSASMISTFFFYRLAGSHNQLSNFSSLPSVKGENGASAGFLI